MQKVLDAVVSDVSGYASNIESKLLQLSWIDEQTQLHRVSTRNDRFSLELYRSERCLMLFDEYKSTWRYVYFIFEHFLFQKSIEVFK